MTCVKTPFDGCGREASGVDAKERRQQILKILAAAEAPVSASTLAAELDVSRQIIVGDVSLLRASGHGIQATPRGYVAEVPKTYPFVGTVLCRHDESRLEEELNTIVDFGATCIDVTVEHGIYGTLTGELGISSRYDVSLFMEKLDSEDRPLSSLSGGLHLHRIGCRDRELFDLVCKALREKGFLVDAE